MAQAKSGFVRGSFPGETASHAVWHCISCGHDSMAGITSSHRSFSLITVLAALTLIMSILHIECSVCCCCLALLPPERGAAPAPRLGFVNGPVRVDETRGFRQ